MSDAEVAPPLPKDPTKPPPTTPAVATAVQQPAPLIDVVMYNLLGEGWKSTLQGFFSFIGANGLVAAAAVVAFGNDPLIAVHPKLVLTTKLAGLGIASISGMAKWYIGIKQKG